MAAILLNQVQNVLNNNNNKNKCNPSLFIDKFTGKCEQKDQKEILKQIVKINLNDDLKKLSEKIQETLQNKEKIDSKEFELQTPLPLHLSRTTMLENAAICLHPIYGFVYIPGSGIKGAARAYARQVLKPAEKITDEEIIDIFGNDNEERKPDNMKAGKIVFYDAYPIIDENYKLKVNINNCHKQGYYNQNDKVFKYLKKEEPNDWENPIPVYYLTLKEGAKFKFYISMRQGLEKKQDLINKAWECIAGALANMGIGAKTSAGYGTMITKENNDTSKICYLPDNQKKYGKLDFYIKFVTHALLGGAEKGENQDDCELTVNTLRGQLRWWWRTMYPNLAPKELLKKEMEIWGSTKNSSPVRIKINENKVTRSNSVLQNFNYIAFGCTRDNRVRTNGRYYISADSTYSVSISCSDSYIYNEESKKWEIKLGKADVMGEVKKSLYLLSKYGGLGAKSRKGFGSFVCIDDNNTNIVNLEKPNINFQTQEISFQANNVNEALSKLNNTYFNFCKAQGGAYKNTKAHRNNKNIKAVLGLPRKSGGRGNNIIDYLINGHPSKIIENVNEATKLRHASPVIFHLELKQGSNWILRITTFPSDYLIDKNTAINFYNELIQHLKNKLTQPNQRR